MNFLAVEANPRDSQLHETIINVPVTSIAELLKWNALVRNWAGHQDGIQLLDQTNPLRGVGDILETEDRETADVGQWMVEAAGVVLPESSNSRIL